MDAGGGVMAEYIEREATIELLRSLGSRDYRREKGTIQDAIKMVSFSEYTPAADVAPVVHGSFIHIGPRFAGGVDWWNCSICGSLVSGVETQFRYCPHCGAKMDGGVEDACL